MGFDSVVNLYTRKITVIHGFPMYFVALIMTIFRHFDVLDLHVETDQESWDLRSLMLALGNGPREGGGFIITPEAKLDDGLLNYVTVKKISRLMMLRLVPEFMGGTHGRFKQVRMAPAAGCPSPASSRCISIVTGNLHRFRHERAQDFHPDPANSIFFLKT